MTGVGDVYRYQPFRYSVVSGQGIPVIKQLNKWSNFNDECNTNQFIIPFELII